LLTLSGEWRAAQLNAIRAEFGQLDVAGIAELTVDLAGADIDLAGAWELDRQLQRLAAGGITPRFAGDEPATLQKLRLETLARAETSAFYSVRIDGRIAAVGVGAVDASGFAGMHGMRTVQTARRLGCARAIVRAAAQSAVAQGATRLYLQVEVANAPARELYRALGFAQAYTYAYWR
jgi:ribosomal protein S18 acetylase RimI-like enzyme